MTVPILTSAPAAPSTSDTPDQFDAKAYPFVGWLAGLATQLNAWIAAIIPLAAASYTGASSSSVAIGTGSKSFTASTGRGWIGGQAVRVADTADAGNWMVGTITSYDSGTGALVLDITDSAGSGTKTSWAIGLEMGVPSTLTLLAYKETVVSASGTAFAPDFSVASKFVYTTTGNATITMPSPEAGQSGTISVIYGGTHTVTWAGSPIQWPFDTEPTATSVSGKKDKYAVDCDDGTNWDGVQSPGYATS